MTNRFKKVVFLFIFCLFLIISFNGCSQEPLVIAKPAQDILEKQEIYTSKIIHIDYNSIEKLDIPLGTIDASLICNRVDETLEVDYSFTEVKEAVAKKGNTILIDYRILNEYQKEIYCDANVKIVIGTGCFDSIIENELLNHKAGDTICLNSSIMTNPLIATHKETTVEIEVKGIYNYNQIGSETLAETHGFVSFEDYYIYLYDIASDELKYEYNLEQKAEFFRQTIKNCNFVIDNDELTSFSLKTVLIHEQQAASFGMTLEEYYTNILELNENDFFKRCTQDSENEIKKMLVVGALAHHYRIIVDDECFDEFCEENNINEDVLTEAYYSCLEEQVISYFL